MFDKQYKSYPGLPQNFTRFKKIFIYLLWFLLTIYFFIIFLPLPSGIITGLDPSWQYVISYASLEKLTYGKDIIFTYGPLGYLIHGAVIGDNFGSIMLFVALIHVIFFVFITIELIKLYKLKNWWKLYILIFYSFIFYLLGAGTDYTILFIFLVILPYEKHFHKKYSFILYSLILGIISGFCLTTKFSLGICTTGAGILYFTGNILGNLKNNYHQKNTNKCLYQLVIFIISSLWTTSIILDGLSKNHASLFDYLKNSLAISSGYSSAMSLVGSKLELAYALVQLVLVLTLLIITTKNKPNSLGYNLSLAFVLWITFKHGFIRQDLPHVVLFVKFTPLLVYLSLRNEININKKSLVEHLLHFWLILTLSVYLLVPLPFVQNVPKLSSPISISSLTNFSIKLNSILNLNKYKEEIIRLSQENLAEMKLTSDVINALQNKNVDIVPWEISLIPANNLTWKPRPIFQSYSAYTSYLDKLNSESILNNKPDYIIYNFMSIDGRHPFFDEPQTFTNIFCNYQISSEFPNFIYTKKLNEIMILKPRQANICKKIDKDDVISMNWNQSYELKTADKEIVRAKVQIQYSILGKIYKTLFRSPPVMMNIVYADGHANSFRIIPENANNGVIISHLPQNSDEALGLFQGELPIPVKSFSFYTINPLLYKSQLKLDLISYRLLNENIRQKKSLIDLSKLENINFLFELSDQYNGVMDSKSEENRVMNFNQGETIFIYGWAFEKNIKQKNLPILITYNSDNNYLGFTKTGNSRPDVAKFFSKSSYSNSGWSINLTTQNLSKGIHKIKAWIYNPQTNQAIPLSGEYKVKIN
ncbi:MAG: hypothetical protein EAZ87_15485 [Nostocales cyanobacterium]|nr:MAG: hypothetical protein EAZ87_15485 [Nostocales cyanobacterium]